ncbi:MAG: anti-sigma factor [Solirubrobacteraceae bacterium]
MSERDRTTENRDHTVDVAAYALGALEPAELDAFRRHLETCPECRADLADYERIVDVLPLSVPARRAPASLRGRVLGEIHKDAQGAEERRPAPRRWLPSLSLIPRSGLAIAAAVVVAALVFAGISLTSSSGGGTRVIQAQVTGPGTVALHVSRNRGSLVVRGFSPPPRGKIYEVWTERGKSPPTPTTALFDVTHTGDGDVAVPGSLRGVSAVLVTPEPPGGSKVPTHKPVIVAPLT